MGHLKWSSPQKYFQLHLWQTRCESLVFALVHVTAVSELCFDWADLPLAFTTEGNLYRLTAQIIEKAKNEHCHLFRRLLFLIQIFSLKALFQALIERLWEVSWEKRAGGSIRRPLKNVFNYKSQIRFQWEDFLFGGKGGNLESKELKGFLCKMLIKLNEVTNATKEVIDATTKLNSDLPTRWRPDIWSNRPELDQQTGSTFLKA